MQRINLKQAAQLLFELEDKEGDRKTDNSDDEVVDKLLAQKLRKQEVNEEEGQVLAGAEVATERSALMFRSLMLQTAELKVWECFQFY